MSRNIQLQVLRGIRANMPVLGAGEMYLCTDTTELYIGDSGNKRVGVSAVLATGPSAGKSAIVSPKTFATGPSNPMMVSTFVQINIAGIIYWVPLFQ